MSFEKTGSALGQLLLDISDRKREISYAPGIFSDDFVFGPKKITVIGAPPGTGKTALAQQIVFDALSEDPSLKLWIANCEMEITDLLKRELSRISGVAHKRIRDASYDDAELSRLLDAAEQLKDLCPRCMHMVPPFDGISLEKLLLEDPGILIVDYLQKFRASEADARMGVDEVIKTLRKLAMEGWAILAMRATSRQMKGHDPESLTLASFKESGEIEFNADAAYLLRDTQQSLSERVRNLDLECVKNRSGALHKIELLFCGDYMRFQKRDSTIGRGLEALSKSYVLNGEEDF